MMVNLNEKSERMVLRLKDEWSRRDQRIWKRQEVVNFILNNYEVEK